MDYLFVGLLGLMGGLIVGTLIGSAGPDREQEALDKGFARYNPQSGDWEWKENEADT